MNYYIPKEWKNTVLKKTIEHLIETLNYKQPVTHISP